MGGNGGKSGKIGRGKRKQREMYGKKQMIVITKGIRRNRKKEKGEKMRKRKN